MNLVDFIYSFYDFDLVCLPLPKKGKFMLKKALACLIATTISQVHAGSYHCQKEKLFNDPLVRLPIAVKFGCLDKAKEFIKLGDNPDNRDLYNITPLMHAARGHSATTMLQHRGESPLLIEDLIKAKAQLNLVDNDGVTALMYAALENNAYVAEKLIAAKADLNVQDHSGMTAMLYASTQRDAAIAEQLIDANADLTIQDYHRGWTALMYASQKGRTEIVEKLIAANVDLDIKDNQSAARTALILASYSGKIDVVDALLKANAKTYIRDSTGYSALDYAKINNSRKIVALFSQYRQSIDIKNLPVEPEICRHTRTQQEKPALIYAVDNDCAQTVKTLLAEGAETEVTNQYGRTALMAASLQRHAVIAKLLIEAGANVKALSNGGSTPIGEAARAGAAEIIELLVQAGVNIETLNKDGETPLVAASLYGWPSAIETLLKLGANTSATDRHGREPIFIASARGHLEAVREFLNAKVDIDRQDADGRTALMEASDRSKADVVRALIKAGADTGLKDKEGDTAISLARTRTNNPMVMRWLSNAEYVKLYPKIQELVVASTPLSDPKLSALMDQVVNLAPRQKRSRFSSLYLQDREGLSSLPHDPNEFQDYYWW